MKTRKQWLLAGIGLFAFIAPLVAAAGIRTRRVLQRTAPFLMPQPPIALRDAGWVHVIDTDGSTARGRGQLFVWNEQATPGHRPPLKGRIDLFTPTAAPLQEGDPVILLLESAQEHVPATVIGIERSGEHTTLRLEWTDGRLPVTLRELGGQ